MAENGSASAFDRDSGYLRPFLDKVRAAGEALAIGREEIAALLAGERERWMRIRELLSGGSSQATTQGRAAVPAAAAPAFTIGTLRRGG